MGKGVFKSPHGFEGLTEESPQKEKRVKNNTIKAKLDPSLNKWRTGT